VKLLYSSIRTQARRQVQLAPIARPSHARDALKARNQLSRLFEPDAEIGRQFGRVANGFTLGVRGLAELKRVLELVRDVSGVLSAARR
jgi:hypothetical protein